MAVAGLVGFVVVYVSLTGWFAYKAVTLLRDAWLGGSGAFWGFAAGILAAFLAVFLGKALFFVQHHPDKLLVEVTPTDEPTLFAFVHRLADEAGAPRPHRVFLSPRVNAAVFYDLSLVNLLFPSRKNLEIGIGLVNVLTLGELKAVLAHEFGHFAQRSMAVGRWVYIGQQIAGNIVAKRDALDKLLRGLSSFDIRVAWIGWGLRIVVWSIRSVMESFFGVVVVAERALSREMELQADLVAVSLSGSDALVHALHKLHAADTAWDKAADILAAEVRSGRLPSDLFAMQTKVIENTRWLLGDAEYGVVPHVPVDARPQHRLFTAALAQPPQMWSTHPPNHLREENVKRRYVPAQLDDREAWVVFAEPSSTRRRLTDKLIDLLGRPEQSEPLDEQAAIAAVDRRFARLYLDPRYRGVYLGRCVTRHTRAPVELRRAEPLDAATTRSLLGGLYPPTLSTAVERVDELHAEKAQLEALQLGIATAPGGVIQYRGQQIRRRELGGVIAKVQQECVEATAVLHAHDLDARTAHWSAAVHLGRGWPEYLDGLLALLHYAEHAEANVDDAAGHLNNVTEVVLADGRVSDAEARRVVHSGNDLQWALRCVHDERNAVGIPFAVGEKLGIGTWAEALPDQFGLAPASQENLGDFMEHVFEWHAAYSNPLGALRHATLEILLEAEAHVARAFLEGGDPGDAYGGAVAPPKYGTRCHGEERERQRRLDWWDRFMVADGWGPGLARLGVAGGIIGLVVGYGGDVGTPTAVVHNGLGRDIVVSIGGTEVGVRRLGRAEVEFEAGEQITVEARTADGRVIETFTAEAGNAMADYVYNVAGASPMVEWTAAYGGAVERPPQQLGAPRWFTTEVDAILEDPPKSISTRGEGGTRSVLSAVTDFAPWMIVNSVPDPGEQIRVLLAHARWEPEDGPGAGWIQTAAGVPGFVPILQERIAEGDDSVLLARLEQDLAGPDGKDEVCARHTERARAEPHDADVLYLATRCMPDGPEQDERFLALQAEHPDHPWLAAAAAQTRAGRDELDAAISQLAFARSRLPAVAGDLALLEARVRRLRGPADASELAELEQVSPQLAALLALDRGDTEAFAEGAESVASYPELDRGALAEAVTRSEPSSRARVVRLAAASDGANGSLVQAARNLAPEDGIDHATVWTAIAFAQAHRVDPAPYVEYARGAFGDDVDAMLAFAMREQLLSDLDAASRSMLALPLELRGHAAAMGVITLGADAPPRWRTVARGLLFASERPYFADAPPTSGSNADGSSR